EGAWTVAKKIIQDDPPMPSSINVALSAEFDRVVAKALAKNPDQRFATAREFAHALRRAAEGKPAIPEAEPTVVVAREPRVPHAPKPRSARDRRSTRPSSSQMRRRRNPRAPRRGARCSCRRYLGCSSLPVPSLISL